MPTVEWWTCSVASRSTVLHMTGLTAIILAPSCTPSVLYVLRMFSFVSGLADSSVNSVHGIVFLKKGAILIQEQGAHLSFHRACDAFPVRC